MTDNRPALVRDHRFPITRLSVLPMIGVQQVGADADIAVISQARDVIYWHHRLDGAPAIACGSSTRRRAFADFSRIFRSRARNIRNFEKVALPTDHLGCADLCGPLYASPRKDGRLPPRSRASSSSARSGHG
jgi:hypothetical protein